MEAVAISYMYRHSLYRRVPRETPRSWWVGLYFCTPTPLVNSMVKEFSQVTNKFTNNRMELLRSLLLHLEALKRPCQVELYSIPST